MTAERFLDGRAVWSLRSPQTFLGRSSTGPTSTAASSSAERLEPEAGDARAAGREFIAAAGEAGAGSVAGGGATSGATDSRILRFSTVEGSEGLETRLEWRDTKALAR